MIFCYQDQQEHGRSSHPGYGETVLVAWREMIPIALFSRAVDEDSLSALAAALESTRVDPAEKQPEEPGKPEFLTLKKLKELKDFVGP